MFVDQGKMWGHIPAAEQDFFLGGSTIAEKYTDGRTTTMKTQKDAIGVGASRNSLAYEYSIRTANRL